jgi:acyl-CoA synthetase (AMP-forming)/AMP-acid ligase II
MAIRTVADQLQHAHEVFASHHALLRPEGWLSFGDLERLARRAAELLADEGATAGARIVLYLENSAMLRVLEHAILGFGMVRVALSPRLHVSEVAAVAFDCDAPIVCAAPGAAAGLRDALRAAGSAARVLEVADERAAHTPAGLAARAETGSAPSPAVSPDDMAMLMYSSGTTGEPKGAVVTHGAWVAQTRNALGVLPAIGPGDVVLAVAPMSHFGGTIGLNCAVSGAATVPMARFDPRSVIDAVGRFSVTVLPLVPVLLTRLTSALTAEDRLVPPLRAVPYGGSPIAADALALAAERLPGVLSQFYGLAEALAPLSWLSPADHDGAARNYAAGPEARERARQRLSSCGTWIPAVEARIVDAEVQVRGEVVLPGYWRRPELTARVRTADGWFATGDLARVDDDGYVHLVDRRNDVIISGGFNVYPGEVERVIVTVDGISEAVVLGLPDERWGEGVHAAVVVSGSPAGESTSAAGVDALLQRITDACRSSLAGYKKPVQVHLVVAIPRNAAGKVDRKALRAQLLAEQSES